MRHINLYKDSSLGRFYLPDYVKSDKNIFRLSGQARLGGNGLMFEASNRLSGPDKNLKFAVKFLRQLSSARVDRFSNEARVMSELNSDHIARFIGQGLVSVEHSENKEIKQDVPWIAMELGGANMRAHVESKGPLTFEQLKAVGPGLCDAVEHLHHNGFIHRDIKPENFVWKESKQLQLLMIDFGIAKRIGEDVSARPMDAFTQMEEFVGPVFFSSPELIEYARDKSHPVDCRSDIFQVGKLMWYLCTGKISAGVPSKKDCPIGGKLRELVLNMVDDDPDERFQTMSDVKAALQGL